VTSPPDRTGPLHGLLVADFSRVLAGPYATMLLADLGADVVKVESPDGDDTRGWVPPTREGVGTYYLSINRNKQSIALDLKDAEDVVLARELARRAEVFIQNFKPGGLMRYGLDYDTVSRDNPAIIYCSISGFGVGRRCSPARLRPAGAGHVRADEPDRLARRPGVPGRAALATHDYVKLFEMGAHNARSGRRHRVRPTEDDVPRAALGRDLRLCHVVDALLVQARQRAGLGAGRRGDADGPGPVDDHAELEELGHVGGERDIGDRERPRVDRPGRR
jgi:CoA-transferase family III